MLSVVLGKSDITLTASQGLVARNKALPFNTVRAFEEDHYFQRTPIRAHITFCLTYDTRHQWGLVQASLETQSEHYKLTFNHYGTSSAVMGGVASMLAQFFPPKAKFSVNDIPDLSGKVVIVTGGNAGIGKETVKALLTHNAKVYLAARSRKKAQAVIDELKKITDKEALFLELDLASLDGVRKSANHFLTLESELHILFNNAGLMWPPMDQVTEDGYDMQFGVHVIGHHLFTQIMIPALVAGAKTSSDHKARIVTTASSAAYTGSLALETVPDGPARRSTTTENQYFQSKFGQVVWALEVARRYGDQGIVSVSLNPGNIQSELQRHMEDTLTNRIIRSTLYPIELGALTQLWGGTSPDVADANGKFLAPWARFGPFPKAAKDPKTGEQLWAWLEAETAKKA